jgi:hypothetical protein
MEPWCPCSILRSIRPISSWIEPAPEYVIEITLPDIEYLEIRRAGRVQQTQVDFIAFLSCESEINWLMDTLSSKERVHLSK